MLWNGQFDDGTQLRDETSLLVALLTGCALQALAFAPRRQYLRVRNGGLHGDFATGHHFIVWACCAPCAASQEARQVDSVQGVEVRCCCRLGRLRAGAGVWVRGHVHAGARGRGGAARAGWRLLRHADALVHGRWARLLPLGPGLGGRRKAQQRVSCHSLTQACPGPELSRGVPAGFH
ncbi:unnamed protein product [Prorocentrum cordatum]|nr:unnamed protein product [Polarella glacialis]